MPLRGSATVHRQNPPLALLGGRQSGKTYFLQMAAIFEAVTGGTVWYTGHNRQYEHALFVDCLDLAQNLAADQVTGWRRANGKQRITFASGGQIQFGVPNFHGAPFDLHCVDEVPNAEQYPSAIRTIKTITL